MLHLPVTGEGGASPIYVGLICDGLACHLWPRRTLDAGTSATAFELTNLSLKAMDYPALSRERPSLL
jgi:hypothetical protein